jgi:hypothetical protein
MAGLTQRVTAVSKSHSRSLRYLMRSVIVPLTLAATAFGLCAHASERASTDQPSPCAKKRNEPYRWEGYNDKPVDACLGPHLYRIPANYFYDQMGPDFQGSVSLNIMWPRLQPWPPGERQDGGLEALAKQISISLHYLDKIPIGDRLDNSIRPLGSKDSMSYDDPIERLDLRDKQPQRFGLTPYYVNRERFDAFLERQSQFLGYKSRARLENERDWYLGHDDRGRLQTVIKCSSHLKSDGAVIQDDKIQRTEGGFSDCGHIFVIPEDDIEVSVGYGRVLLKDWKRIEDYVRELLTRYRVY